MIQHLEKLLAIAAHAPQAQIMAQLSRFGRMDPTKEGAPLKMALRGEERGNLLVEFDDRAKAVFAELQLKADGHDEALARLRRLESQLLRAGRVLRDAPRMPPIRRTSLPLQQLLAWNRWRLDDRRCLQVIVGSFRQSSSQSAQVRLAASMHVDADRPGYGPKMGDVSTGEAVGWDDFYKAARPDLHGRVTLLADAQSTIGTTNRPEPYGPGSVFRIFR